MSSSFAMPPDDHGLLIEPMLIASTPTVADRVSGAAAFQRSASDLSYCAR